MSLDHKAYVFDYGRFSAELAPLLLRALEARSSDALRGFVNADLASFRDPYEGEALTRDWESQLEFGNEHEVGDFALTKFYSPALNIGLGGEWMLWDQEIQSIGGRLNLTLLGVPFGPSQNLFDPGRTGSYFQSADDVAKNLEELWRARRARGVQRAEAILSEARGKGLYSTF